MKSFTYNCIGLRDFCQHHNLDLGSTCQAVVDSGIQYGKNHDTLLSILQLENILQTDLGYNKHEKILISMGS